MYEWLVMATHEPCVEIYEDDHVTSMLYYELANSVDINIKYSLQVDTRHVLKLDLFKIFVSLKLKLSLIFLRLILVT